jgi:hypothetical protein
VRNNADGPQQLEHDVWKHDNRWLWPNAAILREFPADNGSAGSRIRSTGGCSCPGTGSAHDCLVCDAIAEHAAVR